MPLDIPSVFLAGLYKTIMSFAAEQMKRYVGDTIATKWNDLRAEKAFRKQFEEAIIRATQRFVKEYEMKDEDLVRELTKNQEIFMNKEVQEALLRLIKYPTSYQPHEQRFLMYEFASVLPNRKNRERVNRAVSYFLWCLVQEIWQIPELRPVYMLLSQVDIAVTSRQQLIMLKEQIEKMEEIQGVGQEIAEIVKASMDKLLGVITEERQPNVHLPNASVVTSKVRHNLPRPGYDEFVGRAEEIQKIFNLLRPTSRPYLISIEGIGGVGKSSLALEIARRYVEEYENFPPKERFDAIVWISAKQKELRLDGIKENIYAMDTLDTLFISIARVLEEEEIIKETSLGKRYQLVRMALRRHRVLLIVDNLETVSRKEDVVEFLLTLPDPTKVLVTTRHRVDGGYSIHLSGLPKEEALRLIRQECEKKRIRLAEREMETLFERTGGVPLAIVYSIGRIGEGFETVSDVLESLRNPESDIARFCFDASFDIIWRTNVRAAKALLALSLAPSTVNPDTVGYIVREGEEEVKARLRFLKRYSLVYEVRARYSMLPMTRTYARAKLAKFGFEDEFTERWVDWLVRWVQKYGVDLDIHIGDWGRIQEEFDNAIAAMEWSYAKNHWDEYIKLAEGIFDYALINNLFVPLGKIVENLNRIWLTAQMGSPRSIFLIGFYYWYQNQIEKALPFLELSLSMAEQKEEWRVYAKVVDCLAGDKSRKARGNRDIAQKMIEEAKEMVERVFSLARSSNDKYLEYLGHYRLARIYEIENDLSGWEEHLNKAERIASQDGWQRLLAWTLYYKGNFLYKNGNREEALEVFRRGYQITLQFFREQSLVKMFEGFLKHMEE